VNLFERIGRGVVFCFVVACFLVAIAFLIGPFSSSPAMFHSAWAGALSVLAGEGVLMIAVLLIYWLDK